MNNSLTRTKRILIVDDHATVRDGIRYQISRHDDMEICCEASTIESGFRMFAEGRPDLAIVDMSLQDGIGLELIKRIKAYDAGAKILVLSMYNESLYAERALRAGALGYLNKQESREKLIDAVRLVLARAALSEPANDRTVCRAGGWPS